MSLKKAALLIVSLAAMVSLVACGDEPTDGGGNDSDSDSEPVQVDNSPVVPLSQLLNKKYVLDFLPDYWTKPGGDVGKELGKFTPKFAFEITAVDETAKTFTAILGTAKNGVQDTCNMTYTIQGNLVDDGVNPTTFSTVPQDIQVIIEGAEENVKALATLHHFTLTGQFFNQGEGYKTAAGGIVSELDGREIFNLFTLMDPVPDSADTLCENLDKLGNPCETCTFENTVTYCLGVEASLFRVNQANITIIPVAATDTSCL